MARINPEITNEEGLVYHAWCSKHDVIPGDPENAAFVAKYFQETWKEDVTEANLDAAFPLIKDRLKFYAPNQGEFVELFGGLSAEERKAFGDWRGERGLKDSYRNGVALLSWLKAHGFKVTKQNLQLAVGQKLVYPYLEWDESARPRYENPRQHKDDGEGFLPKSQTNKSRLDHIREMREASEKNNPSQAETPILDASEQAWKNMADNLLRDGTHSQQARVRAVYDRELGQGSGWRRIWEACQREANLSKSRSYVR